MRTLVLALALILCSCTSAIAQTAADTELRTALAGNWVGVLEYRDYSEPAGSTKRVDLPTWLTISGATWHYTYDDGPTKTVTGDDTVTFDLVKNTYTETSAGKMPQTFAVSGFETLKQGHGVLVMTGSGKDNDKPADVRLTLTIRRNLMELLQEVRPAGSDMAYSFRHLYRMVRSKVPPGPQQ